MIPTGAKEKWEKDKEKEEEDVSRGGREKS